jgi:hypothetical protein
MKVSGMSYRTRSFSFSEPSRRTRYLLPNQAVTDLAMKPPSTLVELMGTFSKAIPVAVRERPNDLLAVIQEAVKAGAEEVQTVHPAAVNPQAGVPPPSQQAPQSGLWSRPNGKVSTSKLSLSSSHGDFTIQASLVLRHSQLLLF